MEKTTCILSNSRTFCHFPCGISGGYNEFPEKKLTSCSSNCVLKISSESSHFFSRQVQLIGSYFTWTMIIHQLNSNVLMEFRTHPAFRVHRWNPLTLINFETTNWYGPEPFCFSIALPRTVLAKIEDIVHHLHPIANAMVYPIQRRGCCHPLTCPEPIHNQIFLKNGQVFLKKSQVSFGE